MGHGARTLRSCLMAVTVAAAATACAKTAAQETKVEILSGSSREVTILAGARASPAAAARAHCAQYQKQAILRDTEIAGSQMESMTTGSRSYIYSYDCL